MKISNFSKKISGILYALIVLIGNGIHPIINNSRPSSLEPIPFVLMMSFWEFIICLPFVIFERKNKKNVSSNNFLKIKELNDKMKFRLISKLIVIGILFTVAGFFYVEGMKKAGAIPSSIALKSSPIYALIIGTIFLKEKISFPQIFFTILMLTSLYYLGTNGTWYIGQFSIWFGVLLLVPLLWIIGHSLTKPLLESQTISPFQIILIRTGIMVLIFFFFSIIIYGFSSTVIRLVEFSMLKFSFFMGITYFFMHFSWYNSISTISISYASALVTPSPIITVVLATIFLGDSFEFYHLVGLITSIICLYGLILINHSSNNLSVNKIRIIKLINIKKYKKN
ncbi:EamA family transporter [Candidatus Harpocratesius sp.]